MLALVAPVLAVLAAGCNAGYSSVEVKVTLDGAPVDGATVTFLPKDMNKKGASQASGVTNSSGVATMKSGNQSGVASGDYIVLVTKTESATGMDAGASNPMDNMKKAGGGNMPGKPGSGPPGPMKGPSPAQKAKELLPAKYNNANDPQFTVTVPTSGTVNLDLKK
jgi:hypothetical protein